MTAKERIDELRMKKGWSLNRLAEELGLTNTSVYAWYKKEGFNPSAQSIETACEVFGISMTEFYSCVNCEQVGQNETLLLDSFRKVPLQEQEKVLQIVKIFERKE